MSAIVGLQTELLKPEDWWQKIVMKYQRATEVQHNTQSAESHKYDEAN